MKVGGVVKLKNPHNKREAKRRWRVLEFVLTPSISAVPGAEVLDPALDPANSNRTANFVVTYSTPGNVRVRCIDLLYQVVETKPENLFTPISWWEYLMRGKK